MSDTTFIDRIKQEKTDLDDKLTKLNAFLKSDKAIPVVGKAKSMLLQQRSIMQSYSDILRDRLEDLEKHQPA